jgi:serine/threonine protein kinase
VSRFRREASVGMELDHPKIVHIFDMGEDKCIHFIALELIGGGDLEKRIKQRGIFTEKEALRITVKSHWVATCVREGAGTSLH